MFPRSFLWLILYFLCQPAFAITIKVLSWDHDIARRKLAIAYGKKSLEIDYMHPDARSDPFTVPKDAESLRLVALDRTGKDGKHPALPLRIPPGVRKPLLLLLPEKKASTGLRVVVFEDDPLRFRWGTIRLLNMTGKALVFRWDKKFVNLPAQFNPVTVAPGGKSRNIEVMLYLKGALKRPLYSAIWEHRADMRQLVFVVPNSDPSLGPVAFKFIPEHKDDANQPKPTSPATR